MEVYEINTKIYLKEDLNLEDSLEEVTKFIDQCLCADEEMREKHITNEYKLYCYNNLYPLAIDGVFKSNANYNFTLRTVNPILAKYFNEHLGLSRTRCMVGLKTDIKIIPKYLIKSVHTLTPVIIKTEKGYWRNTMGIEDYMERIKANSIKKYNQFLSDKINENFEFIEKITFKNKVPIKSKMKNIYLLGDKIEIDIASNQQAQDMFYFLLGTGICENCSRGYGFLNYQWHEKR